MLEYIDVYTEHGLPTGKIKERSLVHKDADWHRTVHVWIINSCHQLILQLRQANKYSHPCKWDISCAGHVEAGSDSLTTAIKETKEELGIVLRPDELELLFSIKSSDEIGQGYVDNEFHDVYLVEKDVDIAQLNYQREEVAGVKMLHYLELESYINSNHPDYVPHPEEYLLLFEQLHKRFPL